MLADFFDSVHDVTYPDRSTIHIRDAFVRVVNSQMLSTKAAQAIFKRIEICAAQRDYRSIAELTTEEFRACGMSRGKIRSIQEFNERYETSPAECEAWRELSFEELRSAVDEIWGVSTWTAEMLAMFYFGHTDIFPTRDLAINRGVDLVRLYVDPDFSPDLAKPYRTLMARCIWRSFEVSYWDKFA